MARAMAVAVAAAVAAGALPAAVRAQSPPPQIEVRNGTTQPVFSYRDAIRETVYVESSIDGDSDGDLDLLATDIIRPRETGDGLQVPVIYEQSPYYQTLGRGNESEIKGEEDGDFVPEVFPLFYDNYFVPRGYAVVLQDMPGTRNSEGCMVLGADAEELAAKATIEWLNGRGTAFDGQGNPVEASWSTGKTGMIGKSYDGSVANGAASTGVDGLETIVPIGAISRWYDYHLSKGVQYVNAYSTPGLFTFVIDQEPSNDEERAQEWVENTFTENSTCTAEGGQIVAEAADPRADYNAFWDDRDYLKDVDKVEASVFLIHGLNDWNVKPNNFVRWFRALGRQGVDRKIWLAQTGHVDPFDFRREKFVRTLHRWFDRYLHGIRNGIENEPMADIERGPNRWKTYNSWPARSARRVTLWFGPKKKGRPGVLSLRPRKGRQTYSDDAEQEEGEMVTSRRRAKPNRLIFLTRRLRKPVRISGRIHVDIRASIDRVDTNFTGLLVDYGKARRVDHEGSGEGASTTDKESCHGQSTAADDACYFTLTKNTHVNGIEIVSRGWLDGRHYRSIRQGEELMPGQRYRFPWEIFGEDYIFQRGHRIGVIIAGSDATWTIPDPEEANVTVFLRKSRIILPVVGGRTQFRRSRA